MAAQSFIVLFFQALIQLCGAAFPFFQKMFRDDDTNRLPDRFCGCVAEELRGAIVPTCDDALGIATENSVIAALDDKSQLLYGLQLAAAADVEVPESKNRHN